MAYLWSFPYFAYLLRHSSLHLSTSRDLGMHALILNNTQQNKFVCYNWADDGQPTIHYKASLHSYVMLN